MITLLEAATQGVGIYTISEAAKYAKMHAATLRAWFHPKKKRPIRHAQIEDDELKVLGFLDLIEAIAVRSLRTDGVPLQTIRAGIDFAKEKYGVEHIFARKDHRTFIVGKELQIILAGDKDPIGLTGKDAGQKSFRKCIEAYMKDIKYDQKGIAEIFVAYQFRSQKVLLNPKVYFGEPVIFENGFTAETLWQAAIAEGGFKRAAELYEVTPESVEAAYLYCNKELGMAA